MNANPIGMKNSELSCANYLSFLCGYKILTFSPSFSPYRPSSVRKVTIYMQKNNFICFSFFFSSSLFACLCFVRVNVNVSKLCHIIHTIVITHASLTNKLCLSFFYCVAHENDDDIFCQSFKKIGNERKCCGVKNLK